VVQFGGIDEEGPMKLSINTARNDVNVEVARAMRSELLGYKWANLKQVNWAYMLAEASVRVVREAVGRGLWKE
jgi:hypothetical protein